MYVRLLPTMVLAKEIRFTGNITVIPANNTAPTVSAVTISPTSPEEGDTLTCSYIYNDPENDPDASLIQWSVNGVVIPTATTNSISTGFAAGDFVTCTVTASDGTALEIQTQAQC